MHCNRVFLVTAFFLTRGAISWAVPQPLTAQGEVQKPATPPPPVPAGPLNVTVQGQLKGQIQLERIRPPLETSFKDLVEFSRSGQTEKVLKENVGYLGLEEQMKLLTLKSRLVKQEAIGKIPTSPFFVIKNPVYRSDGVARIEFQVVGAGSQVLKTAEVPVDQAVVTWDGYDAAGEFLLKAREVYLPLFKVSRPNGKTDTLAAEGVRFEALRYRSGDAIVIEVYNGSLYPEDLASFSENAGTYLRTIFDELRSHSDRVFDITLHEEPRYEGLARERAELWRQRLSQELLKPLETVAVNVERAGARGSVTRIRMNTGAH